MAFAELGHRRGIWLGGQFEEKAAQHISPLEEKTEIQTRAATVPAPLDQGGVPGVCSAHQHVLGQAGHLSSGTALLITTVPRYRCPFPCHRPVQVTASVPTFLPVCEDEHNHGKNCYDLVRAHWAPGLLRVGW